MEELSLDILDFLQAVDSAFANDKWPQPTPDKFSEDPESAEANAVAAHNWEELFLSGKLEWLIWEMPLLQDRLFAYLLPGFMKLTIVDRKTSWIDIINQLAPPWKKGAGPRICIDLGSLSSEQRDVFVWYFKLLIATKASAPNIVKRINRIQFEFEQYE